MNWLREFLKSSYTLRLEEENARLLAENRALLNTVLGVAGHSPIETPVGPAAPPVIRRQGLSWHQRQRRTERVSEQKLRERIEKERAS